MEVVHFLVYTWARVSIVLEAFLNLRHLPVNAFVVFRWADIILHFQRCIFIPEVDG